MGISVYFVYVGTTFVQSTTVIVETVLVETPALVEQKTLTTQFYLLLVESPHNSPFCPK